MLSNPITFMGIAPSAQTELFTYSLIDTQQKPTQLGEGELEEIIEVVAQAQPKHIGISAPSGLNQGIISDPDQRAERGMPMGRGRPMDCRVGEFEIIQQGVDIYRTPSQISKAKGWMRTGFLLYEHLKEMGIQPYSKEALGQQWIEAPAETCYWLWLAAKPMEANTLEGRIQRQLALYDLGMDIPDPMLFFEEITRFRLLKGIIIEEGLYSAAELHALAAAFMAWAVVNRPDETRVLGDDKEGLLLVPKTSEL